MRVLGAAKFPLILGSDFVGVVDLIGPEANGRQVGEWVYGCKSPARFGTHAEYATVPAAQVMPLPDSLVMEEAAAVPYSFVTAYRLVSAGLGWKGGDCHGRRVLVHGGLGSVGSLATQLLAYWGAEVDISDRTPDAGRWRQLGARNGIDLLRLPRDSVVGKYDAVLNCAQFQNEAALFPLLGREGRYATIVHPLITLIDQYGWVKGGWVARSMWRAQARLVRQAGGGSYRWVLFRPEGEAFRILSAMAEQAILRPQVGRKFSACDAVQAHESMAAGGLQGKIILQMP